jgi:hypothetical protein
VGVVAAALAAWLLLIALQLRPLYDGAGGGPPGPQLLPPVITLGAIGLATLVHLARPSVAMHLGWLAVTVGGVALLAADLGSPFANATETYCGDFCRTAIMTRFAAYFCWPLVVALGLFLIARHQAAALAGWTRAWIVPVVGVGTGGSVIWWRIVTGQLMP